MGVKEEDPATARGHQLVLLFLGSMGDGQAVGVLVRNRLSVDQQHVMMSAVSRDVMNGDVPGVDFAVALERHLLPVGEGTDELHRTWGLGLSVW